MRVFRNLLLTVILCVCAQSALAKTITVDEKTSIPIALNGNASTIIIGDTTIADVSAPSERLVLLSGVATGATNLLVYNADQKILLDAQIIVQPTRVNMLNVYRGSDGIVEYRCNPTCRTLS